MKRMGYFAVCPPLKKITEAGVDWLTCTRPHDDLTQQMWEQCLTIIAAERDGGNDEKRLSWQGYQGVKCGQAFAGARPDGIICRLSGAAAAQHALTLLPIAKNVSRIDFAVTGIMVKAEPEMVRQAFKILPGLSGGPGRPVGYRLVADSKGGDTLYCGSRSSDRFGRFYDKGMERGSSKLGWEWRWEVELKGSAATGTAVELVHRDDAARYVVDSVGSHFRQWRLAVPFLSAEQP